MGLTLVSLLVVGSCAQGSFVFSEDENVDPDDAVYKDRPDINPKYGAVNGLAGSNTPAPHTTEGPDSYLRRRVRSFFQMGLPPQLAVWELLFNRNRTTSTCSATSGQGNQVWIGQSEEYVIESVGRALAYATKVLPNNTTHEAHFAQFLAKTTYDDGVFVRDRGLRSRSLVSD